MTAPSESKTRQRKRDFVLLIIFELATYVVAEVMNHAEYPFSFPPHSWIFGIMLSMLVPYYFLMFKVTSNYVNRMAFKLGYGLLLVVAFVLTGIASRRGVPISDVLVPAVFAYLLQIISFSLIVVIIVVDMFNHQHDLTYGILAATSVYFLIPVFFAYIFCIMGLGNPVLLHADPNDIGSLVVRSFESSHFFAAGIDLPEPGVSDVIKTVSVLEAFIMNLYIVFVVGKLFVSANKS